MPRTPRFILPGCFCHITQRGNDKRDVFIDDQDRRKYLYWLEEYRAKFKVEIFAYCLMNNHVHFIARAGQHVFGKLFNTIHMRYAQYFHRRYKTSGHLWQGRFYSCLLQDSHFVCAVRYVECNPVRAGLVKWSWDWPWSSAREHLEIDKGIVFLSEIKDYIVVDRWKDYLGEEESQDDVEAIRRETRSGRILGSPDFIKGIEKQYDVEIARPSMGRPKK